MPEQKPCEQAAQRHQHSLEGEVPELVKFDLATSRTSQPAEHGVDAHLSPAAIAVHVYSPP